MDVVGLNHGRITRKEISFTLKKKKTKENKRKEDKRRESCSEMQLAGKTAMALAASSQPQACNYER